MAEKYTVKLLEKISVAEGTMQFVVSKPDGFNYRAGQTIDLTLPTEGSPLTHTFSLVSAPHEENLAIATRMRDSAYKNTLKALEPGAALSVEGPYGSFLLHADEMRPAVFLVGGIGITPFMSMIADALKRGLAHTLYLFYSNRRPEDAAFLEHLTQQAEAAPQLHVIPTMTNMDASSAPWQGATGYITWEMLREHIQDENNPVYYTAGPKPMVAAMRTMLTEHGVSEDDIRFEEFPGY